MQVDGSTALVVGGTSGLGLAAARELHSRGASVVVMGRSVAAGEQVVAELGDRVVFSPGDVTNEVDVTAAVERATEFGSFRIALNCAGIGGAAKIIGRDGPMPLPAFDRIVQVNLIGSFNVIRLAAARIASTAEAQGERGVIVNTASSAAFEGQIGQSAYAASKAGIVGMTLPVARELAQWKIRVVTVAPGFFRTPLFETLPQSAVSALGRQVPHPARLGEPSEFASLIAQIVENPMINGETIRLDGALRMAAR